MQILQTRSFQKSVKKLHNNQKIDLHNAIRTIVEQPHVGQLKSGDLSDVRVYKFHMLNQLILLAYLLDDKAITLLAIGSLENFYRALKKI